MQNHQGYLIFLILSQHSGSYYFVNLRRVKSLRKLTILLYSYRLNNSENLFSNEVDSVNGSMWAVNLAEKIILTQIKRDVIIRLKQTKN